MFALTTLLALGVYYEFPMSPPRFLPGFVDVAGTIKGAVALYAAMPSVHFAWAFWSALVLSVQLPWRWAKWLVFLYPVTTLFDILVTGNHFFLDGFGSLAVLAVGYILARAAQRYVPSPFLTGYPAHDLPRAPALPAPRAELRSEESEAYAEFKRQFGDQAPEILRFITGSDELKLIKRYTQIDVSSPKLLGPSPVVLKHIVSVGDGEFEFYSKKYEDHSFDPRIREEAKITESAYKFDLAPRNKLIEVGSIPMLILAKAEGERGLPSIGLDTQEGLAIVETLGFALGKRPWGLWPP
jgi:hypothetical protein